MKESGSGSIEVILIHSLVLLLASDFSSPVSLFGLVISASDFSETVSILRLLSLLELIIHDCANATNVM